MNGKNYIFVKEKAGILEKICFEDVNYIRADKDYCRICSTKKTYHISMGLDRFSTYFPSDVFYRCHRSFLINVDRIEKIVASGVYINGEFIQIAQGRRAELLKMVNYVHSTYEANKGIK